MQSNLTLALGSFLGLFVWSAIWFAIGAYWRGKKSQAWLDAVSPVARGRLVS